MTSKLKGRGYGLKGKEKKKSEEEIKDVVKIIHWLDGYRRFRVADPAGIERLIEDVCPPDIIKRWKRMRKDIKEMNEVLKESPLRRMLAAAAILRFVAISCLMGIFALFMIAMLLKVRLPLTYMAITGIVVVGIVAIPNLYLYLDRYLKRKIQAYYERDETRFRFKMERAKDLAQDLIYYLGHVVKKWGLDPKTARFKLYHSDYDGVDITSKSKWFSKFYTAMPSLGKVKGKE